MAAEDPHLARDTIIESTFEVGHRFRCTMRVDCWLGLNPKKRHEECPHINGGRFLRRLAHSRKTE
jgi:hypothetical protein